MIRNILRGSGALSGILEAHAIDVILALCDHVGGAGRREHEHAFFIRDIGHGDAGTGCHGCQQDIDAVVQQLIISVDGQLAVRLVILRQDFQLEAALRVDLFRGNLRAALHSQAILRIGARQRANDADFHGFLGKGQARGHHHGESQRDHKYFFHDGFPLFSGRVRP